MIYSLTGGIGRENRGQGGTVPWKGIGPGAGKAAGRKGAPGARPGDAGNGRAGPFFVKA